MREWRMEEIEKRVSDRSQSVNRTIIRHRKARVFRRRSRHIDEQKILDILCKKRWERALKEGKVKMINEREWYYEFD